jgi:hypothetical protein
LNSGILNGGRVGPGLNIGRDDADFDLGLGSAVNKQPYELILSFLAMISNKTQIQDGRQNFFIVKNT